MNILTRQEVEGLMERLDGNKFSEGAYFTHWDKGIHNGKIIHITEVIPFLRCFYYWHQENHRVEYLECSPSEMKTSESPIYIGNVLEKIDKTVGGRNYYIGQTTHNDELIHLWSRCGDLSKSLQQIVEASGYVTQTTYLKSPEANALFSFLQKIGL